MSITPRQLPGSTFDGACSASPCICGCSSALVGSWGTAYWLWWGFGGGRLHTGRGRACGRSTGSRWAGIGRASRPRRTPHPAPNAPMRIRSRTWTCEWAPPAASQPPRWSACEACGRGERMRRGMHCGPRCSDKRMQPPTDSPGGASQPASIPIRIHAAGYGYGLICPFVFSHI